MYSDLAVNINFIGFTPGVMNNNQIGQYFCCFEAIVEFSGEHFVWIGCFWSALLLALCPATSSSVTCRFWHDVPLPVSITLINWRYEINYSMIQRG